MNVVIDASALLTMTEPGRPDRLAAMEHMLSGHAAFAPALLAWEVGNAVHRRARGRLGGDLAGRTAILEGLLEGVELVPLESALRRRAGELAERTGLTFYDASYVALAESLGATLVTEDAALLAEARRRLPGKAIDLSALIGAIARGEL